MTIAEVLSIALQLVNLAVGLALLAIAADLWLYRLDGLVRYIIAAFALTGVTFIAVSLAGRTDLSAVDALVRLGRQVGVFYLSMVVHVHLKRESESRSRPSDDTDGL